MQVPDCIHGGWKLSADKLEGGAANVVFIWRWQPCGLLRLVVTQKLTNISEMRTASIIKAGGGSKHVWNAGKLLRDYKAQ
jgi:hypothetical protein